MSEGISEKTIRDKIISMIKPTIKRKRSTHDKGYIYVDDKCVTKVKIPNTHSNEMNEKQLSRIATSLRLSDDDFQRLIECPLRGPEYYEILAKEIKEK